MIALSKGDEPEILKKKARDWTKRLEERQAAGMRPTEAEKSRYRHRDIKSALWDETHGKCAYCESKFGHVTYGDVEHIVPKNSDLLLSFKWDNLTLACDICNTNKGTTVTSATNFIDPYTCDPETRFSFLGPVIWPRLGDAAARLAETRLDLNRRELIDARIEQIERIRGLIYEAVSEPDLTLRQALVDRLMTRELESERPFAAQARTIIPSELRKAGLIP